MAKTFTATWLGDEDPYRQVIYEGSVRFIKGEPTKVPEDLAFNGIPWSRKIRNNPMFAVDEKADVIESEEAEQPEESGTERAALKAELRARGEDVKGNPSVDTLRNRLAALDA